MSFVPLAAPDLNSGSSIGSLLFPFGRGRAQTNLSRDSDPATGQNATIPGVQVQILSCCCLLCNPFAYILRRATVSYPSTGHRRSGHMLRRLGCFCFGQAPAQPRQLFTEYDRKLTPIVMGINSRLYLIDGVWKIIKMRSKGQSAHIVAGNPM